MNSKERSTKIEAVSEKIEANSSANFKGCGMHYEGLFNVIFKEGLYCPQA